VKDRGWGEKKLSSKNKKKCQVLKARRGTQISLKGGGDPFGRGGRGPQRKKKGTMCWKIVDFAVEGPKGKIKSIKTEKGKVEIYGGISKEEGEKFVIRSQARGGGLLKNGHGWRKWGGTLKYPPEKGGGGERHWGENSPKREVSRGKTVSTSSMEQGMLKRNRGACPAYSQIQEEKRQTLGKAKRSR